MIFFAPSRDIQRNGTAWAEYAGIGCGVSWKVANAGDFCVKGCWRWNGVTREDMKVARSATHGGASARGRSAMSLPARRCSWSSCRRWPMFFNRTQVPLPCGSAQTVPFQPASCHGTRIEMCSIARAGSSMAPPVSVPQMTAAGL
ncbi:hypothetical protein [Micromonospora terminaliae]|uniref:Uncharacterized protein n=1 Tax=Micromonospora terminaliae TaxID=1914461 RepID=A0AAJ3DIT1_9ACTN|nr:hypothetical protein [Micromonospora terminaliae]NES28144.1 hypothetical protein [Micromonospora terminaliae]